MRNWKALKPHPFAADYPNWPSDLHEQVVATLLEIGNVDKRKVTLCENLILDGVQFHRACVEADIEPPFNKWDGDPALFVRIKNDFRRHESQEEIIARSTKRQDRVVELKREGKSNAVIAEVVGVSAKTVANQLKKAEEDGVDTSPPDGVVTGADGVDRPVKKKIKAGDPTPYETLEKAMNATVRAIDKFSTDTGLHASGACAVRDPYMAAKKMVLAKARSFCKQEAA